ncbi:tetratricopeptide repeat protein, partial [Verrucomicrobiota bacterium]
DVAVGFYAAGPDDVKTDRFLSRILADVDASALVEWAGLYQAHKLRSQAIQCWQKALDMDRDLFPARIGLAQALAQDRQFDRALAMYEQLARDFPGSFKILIEQARALAWDRKYDESMDLYEEIALLNPDSVVPVMEMARVAAWAKKMEKALEIYARLLDPPLDSRLCRMIQELAEESNSEALQDITGQLRTRVESETPYNAYEMLFDETGSRTRELPAGLQKKIELIRLNLLPAYRTQKAAFLESSGKQLAWHKRFFQAMKPYRELVEFEPGNQEARYDLSQVEFALGMDREAVHTTEQLLDMDPFHSQALLVQQTMDIRDNPYAALGYTYWHEEGRGDLVDIARHRYDAGAGSSLFGRAYLKADAHYWQERPGNRWGSFNAEGFSLQGGGVAAAWLAADAGITFKNYETSGIENAVSGHAEASVNIRDILTLGLRMERMDELYNGFCIEQGIQSDSVVLSGESFLTRDIELNAFGKLSDYSDDNSGEQAYLNIAYAATDHPRILKGAIFGEVRDTDKMTLYEYDADVLVNIEHPYWTPEDYAAWGIILEWYDDRSPVFSRGTDSRFYDVSVTLRDDTESNPAVELKGKLHYEWSLRWVLDLEATLVRSREWDAEGLRLMLKHHF